MEQLPDVIFLDLNMPLMIGEECLADIRSEHRFASIPIVIYSTYMDRLKVEYLFEKGADRYLQKPFPLTV
jgi:CheY-like chemotaxis protein